MTRPASFALRATAFVALLLLPGCGTNKVPMGQLQDPAREKVERMKRIADEVAQDANSIQVAGALEEFTNVPFDAQASPKEAEEILQIYRQRVEGKAGKYAPEIKNAVAPIQAGLKRPK